MGWDLSNIEVLKLAASTGVARLPGDERQHQTFVSIAIAF